MTMLVGCIDFHNLNIKNEYDVTRTVTIIFDSEDENALLEVLKKASDNNFEYEYRDIISRK